MEETKLTAREIFTQISALQKHLTEEDGSSLRHLTNALALLDGEEDEKDRSESRKAQVEAVCDVFKTRELNLMEMLELYKRMYDDLSKDEDN